MTGLEPHPILPMLTQEMALQGGEAWKNEFLKRRVTALMKELNDPHSCGYRPPVWYVADEMLVEGKEVVLVDPAWDIEDPALKKIRPPDFLEEAVRRRSAGLGPIVIIGRRELWVAGSNRSSKTEYAAYKLNSIGANTPDARTWSWSDSEDKSRAKQHPIVYKYLPRPMKNLLNAKGKARDKDMKMGYGPDGFIGNNFTASNGWKHWFNNYKQDLKDVEGDQLNFSWHDEERDPERIKTVRVRLGDRSGLMLVTFTSIDESFMAIVSEYESGMQVLLEVEAEWLPLRKGDAGTPYEKQPGMAYEKVRRVAIAGPGSDGDQKANILHFHIADNPFYGYDPHATWKQGDPLPVYGKRAFYINQNIGSATRKKILSRGYGILTRGAMQQFRFNTAVHMIDPRRIPTNGTRYHLLDPCPGRNWFMIWILIDPQGRWFIYREWPSHSGDWPSAYIPGVGDPGPWALAGTRNPSGRSSSKVIYDGVPGAAQNPFQFGLRRYKEEIDRLEGRESKPEKKPALPKEEDEEKIHWQAPRNPLKAAPSADGPEPAGGERIHERWMDSRYAASPTVAKEAPTTNIEQMADIGLDFLAAPSEQNILSRDDGSIAMVNELLDYDDEVDIGEFSPRLARLNEPRFYVSTECPNVAFALKEWTGKDGQHGACKDPADCVRYGVLCELDYIGEDAYGWTGGGVAA